MSVGDHPTEVLRELRELTGLTMRQMAEAVSRPPSSYQYYETKFDRPVLPHEIAESVLKFCAGKPLDQRLRDRLASVFPLELRRDMLGDGGDGALHLMVSAKSPPIMPLQTLEGGRPHHTVSRTMINDSMSGAIEAGEEFFVDTDDRDATRSGIFLMGDMPRQIEILPRSNPPVARISPRNPAYLTHDVPASDLTLLVTGRVIGKLLRF